MIFFCKKLSKSKVKDILLTLDDEFIPKLSLQVNLDKYAEKLANNALFILFREGKTDYGIIGYYLNDEFAYISTFGLNSDFQGKGIAKKMFDYFISVIEGVDKILLEVHEDNKKAYKFYNKLGFKFVSKHLKNIKMIKNLEE